MNHNFVIEKPNYYNVGLYVLFSKNEINQIYKENFQKSLNIKKFSKTNLKKKILELQYFCESHKLRVEKCYIDVVKNYNSLLENRNGFNDIIRDLENEKINCIITDSYSNFFEGNTQTKINKILYYCFNSNRNTYDEVLKCNRKRFIAIKDNIDTETKINKFNIKLNNKERVNGKENNENSKNGDKHLKDYDDNNNVNKINNVIEEADIRIANESMDNNIVLTSSIINNEMKECNKENITIENNFENGTKNNEFINENKKKRVLINDNGNNKKLKLSSSSNTGENKDECKLNNNENSDLTSTLNDGSNNKNSNYKKGGRKKIDKEKTNEPDCQKSIINNNNDKELDQNIINTEEKIKENGVKGTNNNDIQKSIIDKEVSFFIYYYNIYITRNILIWNINITIFYNNTKYL